MNRLRQQAPVETGPARGKKFRLRKLARPPLPYLAAYLPAADFVAEFEEESRTVAPTGTITTRAHPVEASFQLVRVPAIDSTS